jgi:hypothetical protein
LNKTKKKLKLFNQYTIDIESKSKENIRNKNNSQNAQKKNISLNKIQNEIKMIELKLRSDIIKNKLKRLNDLSNDNKYKYRLNTPQKNDEIFLYEKRSDDKKVKKIFKMKINDTGTKNFFEKKRKNIIDLNNDFNDCNGNTYYQTNINNFYNINNNNNNNSQLIQDNKRLNSEQVQNHKTINTNKFGLNQNSYNNDIIKAKINKVMNLKKNDSFIKIKDISFFSNIKAKNGLTRNPSSIAKKTINYNFKNNKFYKESIDYLNNDEHSNNYKDTNNNNNDYDYDKLKNYIDNNHS